MHATMRDEREIATMRDDARRARRCATMREIATGDKTALQSPARGRGVVV